MLRRSTRRTRTAAEVYDAVVPGQWLRTVYAWHRAHWHLFAGCGSPGDAAGHDARRALPATRLVQHHRHAGRFGETRCQCVFRTGPTEFTELPASKYPSAPRARHSISAYDRTRTKIAN